MRVCPYLSSIRSFSFGFAVPLVRLILPPEGQIDKVLLAGARVIDAAIRYSPRLTRIVVDPFDQQGE